MAVRLVVNGVLHLTDTDPETPLLWVLRGEVGDRSVKYGCGAEQCGACRVLVEGRPAWSCAAALGEVANREITTPAGLAGDRAGAAVQQALLSHNAGQCGYCLPGIAVTLTDLVRRGGAHDAAGVRAALDHHLCRCGAHPRIVRAALDALASSGEAADGHADRAGRGRPPSGRRHRRRTWRSWRSGRPAGPADWGRWPRCPSSTAGCASPPATGWRCASARSSWARAS